MLYLCRRWSYGAASWPPCRASVMPLQPSRPLHSHPTPLTHIRIGVLPRLIRVGTLMTIYRGRNGPRSSPSPPSTSPTSPIAPPNCPRKHMTTYLEYIPVLPISCRSSRTGVRWLCKPSYEILGFRNNDTGLPQHAHSPWASAAGVLWGTSPVAGPLPHLTARYPVGLNSL